MIVCDCDYYRNFGLVIFENLCRVRMKYRTGFLIMACAWMAILLPNSDAGHAWRKDAAGASCRPKALTTLTEKVVELSLTSFDEHNGKHLGTWSPGFPELQVHQNSPLQGSKVQCSLIFMAQGLEKVLEDQSSNLNPEDVSLHQTLKEAFTRVNFLAKCLKDVLGGECHPNPSPPQMPKQTFERKQWSHTLLKTARDYLRWLESKLVDPIVKATNTKKRKVTEPMHLRYLEGSGYLL